MWPVCVTSVQHIRQLQLTCHDPSFNESLHFDCIISLVCLGLPSILTNSHLIDQIWQKNRELKSTSQKNLASVKLVVCVFVRYSLCTQLNKPNCACFCKTWQRHCHKPEVPFGSHLQYYHKPWSSKYTINSVHPDCDLVGLVNDSGVNTLPGHRSCLFARPFNFYKSSSGRTLQETTS